MRRRPSIKLVLIVYAVLIYPHFHAGAIQICILRVRYSNWPPNFSRLCVQEINISTSMWTEEYLISSGVVAFWLVLAWFALLQFSVLAACSSLGRLRIP
jgi:hypothetical protein